VCHSIRREEKKGGGGGEKRELIYLKTRKGRISGENSSSHLLAPKERRREEGIDNLLNLIYNFPRPYAPEKPSKEKKEAHQSPPHQEEEGSAKSSSPLILIRDLVRPPHLSTTKKGKGKEAPSSLFIAAIKENVQRKDGRIALTVIEKGKNGCMTAFCFRKASRSICSCVDREKGKRADALMTAADDLPSLSTAVFAAKRGGEGGGKEKQKGSVLAKKKKKKGATPGQP